MRFGPSGTRRLRALLSESSTSHGLPTLSGQWLEGQTKVSGTESRFRTLRFRPMPSLVSIVFQPPGRLRIVAPPLSLNTYRAIDLRIRNPSIACDAMRDKIAARGSGMTLAIRNPVPPDPPRPVLVIDADKEKDKADQEAPRRPRKPEGSSLSRSDFVSNHSFTFPPCAIVPYGPTPPACMMSAGPAAKSWLNTAVPGAVPLATAMGGMLLPVG